MPSIAAAESRLDCRTCPVCGTPFYRPERFNTCRDAECSRTLARRKKNADKAFGRRSKARRDLPADMGQLQRTENNNYGPYAVIYMINSPYSGHLPIVHGQYRTEGKLASRLRNSPGRYEYEHVFGYGRVRHRRMDTTDGIGSAKLYWPRSSHQPPRMR